MYPLEPHMPIIRQAPDFHSLTPDGRATERKDDASLAYQVAIEIAAPPERVMGVLTKAADFPRWNSTILRFEGEIALGRKVKLVSTVAPKRAFSVKVSALSADAMSLPDMRATFESFARDLKTEAERSA